MAVMYINIHGILLDCGSMHVRDLHIACTVFLFQDLQKMSVFVMQSLTLKCGYQVNSSQFDSFQPKCRALFSVLLLLLL